mgnify:CR=1 FL=1
MSDMATSQPHTYRAEFMHKTTFSMIVLASLIASPPGRCETASLEEMRLRCQEAREIRIAPLRKAAIEECVSRHRSGRTPEDCERLYSDFGEGGGTVGGGFRTPMFNDLAECVEYF